MWKLLIFTASLFSSLAQAKTTLEWTHRRTADLGTRTEESKNYSG